MSELNSIGEDQFIKEISANLVTQDNVLVAAGDDCAVLKNGENFTLLKTDTIIENVHYLPSAAPFQVGWKAVARVVSDFAAMGGKPDSVVIALGLKKSTKVAYAKKIYEGMNACAEAYQFSIVGGETSSCECNIITVSGTGSCDSYVTRSGGQADDFIYVTGKLGGSIQGKHLTFNPRVREAEWIKDFLLPTAMMDLSDGLAKDLPRLADLSQTGFFVDFRNIPLNENQRIENGIGDGEDYELLFTSPIAFVEDLKSEWEQTFPDLEITCIGKLTESTRTSLSGGWEHFTS